MVKVKEKNLAAIGRWGVLLPPAVMLGFGGLNKFTNPALWRDEFVRWGYPAWMAPATGALELAAVLGMLLPWTRFYGACLATVVMLAAAGTRIWHAEFGPAAMPLVVAALAALTAWWARPAWVEGWLDRREAARAQG